ncbi:MAG TPA: AsmA-like C-terminal region-containing protein, partial [Candidatus Angelobacter sp.]
RIPNISAANASAKVLLQDGHLRLTDFVCDLFGGRNTAEWRADFSNGTPSYFGEGRVEGASAAALAEAMQDDWVTGILNAKYRITFSGKTLDEMISMAAGSLDFDLRDGTLRRMAPSSGDGPLHVQRFFGRLALQQGAFSLPQSRLETSTGIYTVTGTASLNRKIDFTLRDRTHAYSVRGTLSNPRISALPMIEQAAADK